jgi:hypothetical protein
VCPFTRQTLSLPAVTTVAHRLKREIHDIKSTFGNREASLSPSLQQCGEREGFRPGFKSLCTLAFNATLVISTGIRLTYSTTGSCFVFNLLAPDHRYPDLFIQSVHLPNRKINQEMCDIRNSLLGIFNENDFECHFIATDGDNGRNSQHEQAFQIDFPHRSTDVDEIISGVTDNGNSGLDH